MGLLDTAGLQKFATGFETRAKAFFAKKTDIPETLPANGGNAATVGGHTVAKDVPSDAVFTDTKYSAMTAATASTAGEAGLVPAPGAGKQNAVLHGNGTWGAAYEVTSDADIDAIIAGTFQ